MSRTRAITLLVLPVALFFVPQPAHAQFRYPPIYPSYRYAAPESDLRFSVEPKDAAVYVDGYFAGRVDDFDGAFQRLRVTPGEHEIVVYLEGYRSLRQRLYLSPNTTRKVEGSLEKLPAGEPLEPAPLPPPESNRPEPRDPYRTPPARGPQPRGGQPPAEPADRRPPPPEPRDRPEPSQSTSGTLSVRVQPSGATVLIDGERWAGPSNNERLIVQVPEGRHRVEVERDGYMRFVTEIDVRSGQTAPVNISLTKQ